MAGNENFSDRADFDEPYFRVPRPACPWNAAVLLNIHHSSKYLGVMIFHEG
jgi:hypothetical protein